MFLPGGVNHLGYPLQSIVVRDDYTNAVPVAHMISSAETAAVLQIFLQRVQQAAGFTFSYCMIDLHD